MFILLAMVATSFVLFSYVRSRSSHDSENKENCECGKCAPKQNEYILWESLTHNLFSVSY
jgi:hypothetical protein